MDMLAAILSLPIPLVIPGLFVGWGISVLVRRGQMSTFGEIARDSTNQDI
jgi:hypothetical protein